MQAILFVIIVGAGEQELRAEGGRQRSRGNPSTTVNSPMKDNFDWTTNDTSPDHPDGDGDMNPNAVPTVNNTPTTVSDIAAAAGATPTNSSINETIPSTAQRAKINISLKTKSKPPFHSSNLRQNKKSSASTNLGEEYTTIAEEAEIISQRRKEEGLILVIPCKQSKNEEEEQRKKQPLLAGRLAILRRQQDEGGATVGGGDAIASRDGSDDFVADRETAMTRVCEIDDEVVMMQLIQSAERTQGAYDSTSLTIPDGQVGLVIAAPSQNKLHAVHGNDNDDSKADDEIKRSGMELNDDDVFKRELSHHAADVDPTSTAYANVAIGDFGSALLRGMGWSGGSDSVSTTPGGRKLNEPGGGKEVIKPRPHRLGLGATPLMPLPPSGGGGVSSSKPSNRVGTTIHRRARRPEEVKRDEERQRQQEDAEKREEERKRLDSQFTLQQGSIVHVVDQDVDANGHGRSRSKELKRALVTRTAGVPGLNRILVQMEGAATETSVTKHGVSLCSWEEIEMYPFQRSPLQGVMEQQLPTVQKDIEKRTSDDWKHSRSDSIEVMDGDLCGQMRDGKKSDRKNRHYSSDDDDSTVDSHHHRSKDSKRNHSDRDKRYRRRSRSRSDSSERCSKRRKGSSASRKGQDGGRKHRRRDRSRSPEDGEYPISHRTKQSKQGHQTYDTQKSQQHLYWLIPNIRVRLISKKLPKYHLQKGVVQDVILTSTQSSSSGSPKAILLMDNDGQVLDKVPERYLETALPKTGGNVIILEGKEIWKKGRLLERSSKRCIIQLEEDLEVVNVSLDSVAEWCGRLE